MVVSMGCSTRRDWPNFSAPASDSYVDSSTSGDSHSTRSASTFASDPDEVTVWVARCVELSADAYRRALTTENPQDAAANPAAKRTDSGQHQLY